MENKKNGEENFIYLFTLVNQINKTPAYYCNANIAYGGDYKNEKLTSNKKQIGKNLVELFKEEKSKNPIHLITESLSINIDNLKTIRNYLKKNKFPNSKFYLEKKV